MIVLKVFNGLFTKSVFRKIPANTAMNDILAIIFHRLAATIYLIYALWAFASLMTGLPSIVRAEGDQFQFWFSSLVLIFTVPACLGATFWPRLARLELFAGSAFTGLLILYYYFLIRNIFESTGSFAGFILLLSVIVLPACRTIVVVVLLLRQARDEKELQRQVS